MTDSLKDGAVPREWTVAGMDCAACALKIRGALERLPGVENISVAVMSERLRLTLDEAQTPASKIESVLKDLGYGPRAKVAGSGPLHEEGLPPDACGCEACLPPFGGAPSVAPQSTSQAAHNHSHNHDDPAERDLSWYQTGKGRLVLLTGALLVLATVFAQFATPQLSRWIFTIACLIGLAPIARRAYAALRMGQPFTIESLMTIAALGALGIDAAEEAALVVFLFAVGEVLEGVAAGRARAGIRALSALVPSTAFLEVGEETKEVSAQSLREGQVIRIRPGDRIGADGLILEGTSGIDESPVTGESVPVLRTVGESVFAGTINTDGVLRVRVTASAEENTISRIIRLVEEAEEARAPTERFIDRFSRWYMPAIVLVSALVIVLPPLAFGADWQTWIYRGLSLLLIGCPCALVISVPASIASALSAGAKRGLLMKGGAVIEATAKITQVAFDKTGTLTQGRPLVTDILPSRGTSLPEILAIAAAVEGPSSHPLAQAINARAAAEGAMVLQAIDARALPGRGAEAWVSGMLARVASPRQAEEDGGLAHEQIDQVTALEAEGKTVVAVYCAGNPMGLIALRDEPRAEAAGAVAELQKMGVGAVMLTGDNPRTAAAIASGLGVEFKASMMPADKLEAIRDMAQSGVMMVGDGINDAPALKQASVGVAMGSGTDVALEAADAAILRNRLVDVAAMIRLARATMGNIRQNVGLALGLKAIFLVTSVMGITGLWIAILADTGATVLVTLNALRLLRYNPSKS